MPSPVLVQTRPWSDWDPSLYMKFMDERTRAARDLLARVPLDAAKLVYDLGCGPGNSLELLSLRFAEAELVGVDTSEAMLAHARLRAPKARFIRGDIGSWAPDAPPNLIFSNSALHFLPNHHKLFARLAASRAWRRARRANAVQRQRILARAHAHGRGGGTVVVEIGPGRKNATADRLPR